MSLLLAAALTIAVPFEKLTLDNGLVVILHEDRRVPLVAVDVTYAVGSADEPPGRTGFAHLFEHLMFMGTARAPRGAFDAWMEAEGAWSNAWTSEDATEYLSVGPSHALPLLLWLEADRMQALGGQIDRQKLDVQRDVVRNERREAAENTPFGVVDLELPALLWPPGHPYHHPVIGSHEDLQAATVEDVRAFFARWYVPNNASLVIAGDFDAEAVKPLLRRYFGAVPRGADPRDGAAPPPPRPAPPAPQPLVLRDRVDAPRVVLAWRSPAAFAPGDAEMAVVADLLTDERTGRLYETLVARTQIARDVGAVHRPLRRGSQFVLWAEPTEQVTPDVLEAALRDALAEAIHAFEEDEVARARARTERLFVEELQSLRNRAGLLNFYQLVAADPGALERDLARYRDVTLERVRAVARDVLRPEDAVRLRVVPADP